MKEFINQWAVILGGSSGLGLATAKKLASHGLNICIVHRDRKSNLKDFQSEIKAMEDFGVTVKTFNKDALNSEVRKNIISSFEKKSVKILVHSIAKGSLKKMNDTKEEILKKEDIDITIHAMATSWYQWTQALVSNDCFSEKARNLAFTSEGNRKVWPGYGAVSAAKAVLESLMRNMAVEFAPRITSNCIQAGTTETPSFSAIPGSNDLAKMAKTRNPFKRLTTPENIADVVYLLVRPEADWINGAVLNVDGGESLR